MPSRTAVRETVQLLATKEREKFASSGLKTVLNCGGGITCDGLKQKVNGLKYYDLVLHYIDAGVENPKQGYNNVRLVSCVLVMCENRGGESAMEINQLLDQAMQQHYSISFNELMGHDFTFVTDCASNMPRVVGRSVSSTQIQYGDRWIGCICHQLNTLMKKVFDHDERAGGLVSGNVNIVKKIVKIFKQSNLNNELAEGFTLIQDVETRFGIVHDVVERFLKSAQHVARLAERRGIPTVTEHLVSLHQEQIDCKTAYPALNGLISAFGCIRDMQNTLEASNTPTMHLVTPMAEHVRRCLYLTSHGRTRGGQPQVPSALERNFCSLTVSKLDDIEVQPRWIVGTLLHPGPKSLSCVWDSDRRA